MQTFLIYQIKVIILLSIFYFAWKMIYKKDNYHQVNRFFLLFSVCFSFVIPMLNFNIFSFENNSQFNFYLQEINIATENIAEPIKSNLAIFSVLKIIYFSISTILAISFILKIVKVLNLKRTSKIKNYMGVKINLTEKNISPFVFLNEIFLNKNEIESSDFNKIIKHEQIHVSQLHSVDIILMELILIFQWFNPLLYFYRKELKSLHEYICDQNVINSGIDAEDYKLLLIKKRIGIQPGFASNFNKSLTLKRIIMLKQPKSSKKASFKLLFAFPLLLVSFVLFSFNFNNIQQPNPLNVKDSIYIEVDQMPVFPGGEAALMQYIANNVNYPDDAVENGWQEKVFVQFVVSKTGKVENVEVVRGQYESLNKEAIRVIKSLPNFSPAINDGQPVAVSFTIPINFKLEDKE